MSNWDGRLGVFDLETTGVDTDVSRIVSACIAVLDGEGQVIARWDWLLDPGVEIPDGASAVHGITTEQARAEGRSAEVGIAEIAQTLRVLFADDVPVTVYNAPYDLTLLDRECRRHRIEPIEDPSPVIDPLVIDKAVDRYRKGKRTLEMTAELYGVQLDDAHDAGADAIAAGRVAQALARAYPEDLDVPFADLHGRQEIWFAEQAQNFEEYVRTKPDREGYVADRSWPVRHAGDPNTFVDTRPLPALPPRPGAVPLVDFSSFDVRAIEASRTVRGSELTVLELVESISSPEPTEPDAEGAFAIEEPVASGPEPEPGALSSAPPPRTPAPAVLRIAAAIVTDPEGRSLLVRKRGTRAFMQPGGKVEPGESAVDALTRELREELGLEFEDAEYLGIYRAPAANEENTMVSAAVFAVTTTQQLAASAEIEELLWVDRIDDIEAELAPLTRDELLPVWESRRAATSDDRF